MDYTKPAALPTVAIRTDDARSEPDPIDWDRARMCNRGAAEFGNSRAARRAEIAEQCRANGRCYEGPRVLVSEDWSYRSFETGIPLQDLIARRETPLCRHGNMAAVCPHWSQRKAWGTCEDVAWILDYLKFLEA